LFALKHCLKFLIFISSTFIQITIVLV